MGCSLVHRATRAIAVPATLGYVQHVGDATGANGRRGGGGVDECRSGRAAPDGDAERFEAVERADEGDDRDDSESGGRFTVASASYLVYYNLGTIVLGLAEPREELLFAPIFAVGGALNLIGMSDRITPRALTAVKVLLPMIAAILTVTATANGWWPL